MAVGTIVQQFCFFSLKEEKQANDYKLSADRTYVAFTSNYSKVDSLDYFCFNAKVLPRGPEVFWFLSHISCGGIRSRLHTHFTTEHLSKCQIFSNIGAYKLLSVTSDLCLHQSLWKVQSKLLVVVSQKKGQCICFNHKLCNFTLENSSNLTFLTKSSTFPGPLWGTNW